MELKEFIKKVLVDLTQAVEEVRAQAIRDMVLYDKEGHTVGFDIAVSAENVDLKAGKTGIRVLQFAEAGGTISKESKNATVSRVKFSVRIDSITKEEDARNKALVDQHNRENRNLY